MSVPQFHLGKFITFCGNFPSSHVKLLQLNMFGWLVSFCVCFWQEVGGGKGGGGKFGSKLVTLVE